MTTRGHGVDDAGIDELLAGSEPEPGTRRVSADLTRRGFGIALVALTIGFAIVLAVAGLSLPHSAIRPPAVGIARSSPGDPPVLGEDVPAGVSPSAGGSRRSASTPSRDSGAGSGHSASTPDPEAGGIRAVAQPVAGTPLPAQPASGQPVTAPPAGPPAPAPPAGPSHPAGGHSDPGPPRHVPRPPTGSARNPAHNPVHIPGRGWGAHRPGRPAPVLTLPVLGIPAPNVPLPSLPVLGTANTPGSGTGPIPAVPHHPWAPAHPAAPHPDPVPPPRVTTTDRPRPAPSQSRPTPPNHPTPQHQHPQHPAGPVGGLLSLLGLGSLALTLIV
ncbi:MAG: hypothetical protein QOJ50_2441 [Cryptosporangiaceae bacterium]|nr:hypothetical protein [Cryptosporangiaceae bacterium]